jgi:DNA-binding NtrC family response regulator
MFFSHSSQKKQSPNSFYAPPSSIAPTHAYDRQSRVLVVSKNDDVLKFMKIHLNRYFSHVDVFKSYTDGFDSLGNAQYDLAIVQANPKHNPTMVFLKRMGSQHRSVPTIVIDPDTETTANQYAGPVVVDVISPPFDLDKFHIAIRKSLEIRADLKNLDEELPPRSNIGQLVRGSTKQIAPESKHSTLIQKLRQALLG